ncbi:MAG: glycine dehydrogenase, partial [Candidatus Nanopelagicales bacterium]
MSAREFTFVDRHIGPDETAVAAMLAAVGYSSLDALTAAVVPEVIAWTQGLNLPQAVDEATVLAELRDLASRNVLTTSMIGLGYSDTHTPAVIRRNVLENPAWYTAYTPYQPEISQGRLEALLNFQTMIEDLTALPVAGSSLLDEPTAAAEAMALAVRQGPKGVQRFLVDADSHPQTLAVLRTRAEPIGIELVVAGLDSGLPAGPWSGVLVSYPSSSGVIKDIAAIIDAAHDQQALAVVAADLLALTLLTPPGELGADIVVGSAQRFGVPMGFGGPHAGFMSVRAGLERSLPGRLVGVSVDADGNPAYRLALQTREQHIRREKATSNICTAQVLLAIISAMYASYHGPQGLTAIAQRVQRDALTLRAGLDLLGVSTVEGPIFDTVRWAVPGKGQQVADAAAELGIAIRVIDADSVSASTDEVSSARHVEALWAA